VHTFTSFVMLFAVMVLSVALLLVVVVVQVTTPVITQVLACEVGACCSEIFTKLGLMVTNLYGLINMRILSMIDLSLIVAIMMAE